MRALTILALAAAACTSNGPAPVDTAPVTLHLIAFNDFHGQLTSPGTPTRIPDASAPGGSRDLPTGGVAWLAGLVAQLKAQSPLNIVVAAGDLVGGSPLESALFHDEPTIEVLNAMGLEFSAVGNHEFDEGLAELKRMQNGGCRPTAPDDSCHGHTFAGARFTYLAANVADKATGKPVFPASTVKTFDLGGGRTLKVGFIGAVVKSVPDLVVRGGVDTLSFGDEAAAANAVVPALRAQGVDGIVLLIHEGGRVSAPTFDDTTCPNFSGDILQILDRLDPAIDVVISGHTHRAYICRHKGRLVTSAGAQGRYVTDVQLIFDRQQHRLVGASARQLAAVNDTAPNPYAARYPTVEKDPQAQDIVARYAAAAAPLADRAVAAVTGSIANEVSESGESAIGDLIADAQLAATAAPGDGGAQVAFMNVRGIRTGLHARNGHVTYGAIHAVHPFGNVLVTMSLTGADLHELLEQQWTATGSQLVPSAGFTYEWSGAAPAGAKVDASSIRLNGVVIDPARSYRVTVNEFLAGGGDGFMVLTRGTDKMRGIVDIDALERYLVAHSPVSPPRLGRVRKK
jgi:5'-nucleotidase